MIKQLTLNKFTKFFVNRITEHAHNYLYATNGLLEVAYSASILHDKAIIFYLPPFDCLELSGANYLTNEQFLEFYVYEDYRHNFDCDNKNWYAINTNKLKNAIRKNLKNDANFIESYHKYIKYMEKFNDKTNI